MDHVQNGSEIGSTDKGRYRLARAGLSEPLIREPIAPLGQRISDMEVQNAKAEIERSSEMAKKASEPTNTATIRLADPRGQR